MVASDIGVSSWWSRVSCAGRVTTMRHPCGSRRSGWMSPPWRSTIHWAMARPRPAPPSVEAPGRVGAVEAFEDACLVGLGDAGALVEHLDGDAVGAAPRAHLDRAAARRVAHRVLEQVGDHLVHALGIAVGGEVGGVDRHRHRDLGRVQLLLADRVREERLDPELGAVERHRARLEPGQVEELLDQAAQPLDLGEHRAERLGVGLGDAVDQVLEHRLQRGDGRAQLVATRWPRGRAAPGRSRPAPPPSG